MHSAKKLVLAVALVVAAGCSDSKKNGNKNNNTGSKSPKPVPNTSAKNTLEVRQMFAQLRIGLERYHQQKGTYPPSQKESERWPPVRSHGQTHSKLTMPALWEQLKVRRDPNSLRCAYAIITGKPHDPSTVGPVAQKRFGMTQVDKQTSSTGQLDRSIKKIPDQDWYYLLAECDGDGDPKRNAFWLLRNDLRNTFKVDRRR